MAFSQFTSVEKSYRILLWCRNVESHLKRGTITRVILTKVTSYAMPDRATNINSINMMESIPKHDIARNSNPPNGIDNDLVTKTKRGAETHGTRSASNSGQLEKCVYTWKKNDVENTPLEKRNKTKKGTKMNGRALQKQTSNIVKKELNIGECVYTWKDTDAEKDIPARVDVVTSGIESETASDKSASREGKDSIKKYSYTWKQSDIAENKGTDESKRQVTLSGVASSLKLDAKYRLPKYLSCAQISNQLKTREFRAIRNRNIACS